MKIVTNSTPLIELSKIKQLDLLRKVYGLILTPEEVYIEVAVDGAGKQGCLILYLHQPKICQTNFSKY